MGQENKFTLLNETDMNVNSTFRAPLRGIIPPTVTPLLDSEALDVPGLERLIEHMIDGGTASFMHEARAGDHSKLLE